MHLDQGISLFHCEISTSLVTKLKIRGFSFVSSEISENGTIWKTLDKKATEHFFCQISNFAAVKHYEKKNLQTTWETHSS